MESERHLQGILEEHSVASVSKFPKLSEQSRPTIVFTTSLLLCFTASITSKTSLLLLTHEYLVQSAIQVFSGLLKAIVSLAQACYTVSYCQQQVSRAKDRLYSCTHMG